jgi:hypothetical protein
MRPPRLKRLPSPSLIIACVALFVALGGTSYALATGSITSREIQDGTIRNPDFKDGTLRGQEFKRDSLGGGAIKESTLGTVPSATTAVGLTLQVVVAADGTRSNDRGVVSTTKTATGRFQVVFDRDVRGCVVAATLVQSPPPTDDLDAPGTGQIAVAPLADNANGLRVVTAASGGAFADRAFHLLLSC